MAALVGAFCAIVALAPTARAEANAGTAALRVVDAREAPPTGLLVDLPGRGPIVLDGDAGPLGYLVVDSGRLVVGLAAAPEDEEVAAPARLLARLELELGVGRYHTLVVMDAAPDGTVVAPPGVGPAELDSLLLDDELERLPAAGHAALRIVHAASALGSVLIRLRPHGGMPSAPAELGDDGAISLEPLSATGWIELLAGAYQLEAAADGTPAAAPPLQLRSGAAYTLYVTGLADGAVTLSLRVDAAMPAPPHHGAD